MGAYDEPIVSKCKKCGYKKKGLGSDDNIYCVRHPFPRMQWLGGFSCPDATFIEKKVDYDYTDEGRYDSRSRVKKRTSKNKI